MNPFHIGDIVTIKPEYSHKLIETYFYNDAKCNFGIAVAHGVPAKVVATTTGCVYLNDLEETLDRDDCLHLNSKYFDAFMTPIPEDLL